MTTILFRFRTRLGSASRVPTRVTTIVVLFAAHIALGTPAALGCRDPDGLVRTFLDRLPRQGMKRSVVARIEIVKIELEKSRVQAKVIEARKGTKLGAMLMVRVKGTSCDVDPDLIPGQIYYISGETLPGGDFAGEWKWNEIGVGSRLEPSGRL